MSIKPVKWYTSSFENAPVVDSANGDLTKLLDAVLVNGFNVKTVSSITQTGGVATLTFPGTHGFVINQIIEIAGCNEAAYNGQFVVTSKTTSTLSFAIDPASAASATTAGTITVKTPALGFNIAYTGTNVRAYQSTNALSNKLFLRVDDSLDPNYNATYAKFAKVMMVETMTDINTFTGATAPFRADIPTAAYQSSGTGATVVNGWYKWYYSAKGDGQGGFFQETLGVQAGAKNWVIIGDDRGFYIFIEGYPNAGRTGHCFTDFQSYRAGDAYNTLLTARDAYITASSTNGQGSGFKMDFMANFPLTLDLTGKILLKDYQQVGANVRAGFVSLNTNNSSTVSGWTTGVPWPNGPDYGLILHPVYLKQENNHIRGKIPGMMWVHNDQPMQHLDFVTGVSGYPGRTFMVVTTSYANGVSNAQASANIARMVFDVTGPWW